MRNISEMVRDNNKESLELMAIMIPHTTLLKVAKEQGADMERLEEMLYEMS